MDWGAHTPLMWSGKASAIAPATLSIWMNGHPLIENIDYTVDYPSIYIWNKQFITTTGTNHFVVMAEGLSPTFNSPLNQSELGYIVGGVLGYNGRYNIRDDRNTRIIAGGRLWMPSDIPSSELSATQDASSTLNGFPYCVKHVYQTIKDIVPYASYNGFDAARDLDSRISAYMTQNYTKVSPIIPNLQDKYRLFSPFLSEIVNAIVLKLSAVS